MEKIQLKKFSDFSNQYIHHFEKKGFSLLSILLPDDVESLKLSISHNDCPEMKYLLSQKDDLTLKLVDEKKSLFLLKMSEETEHKNLDWTTRSLSSNDLELILNEKEQLVHSGHSKSLNLFCPFWGENSAKKFTFESNVNKNFKWKLEQARLLSESSGTSQIQNDSETKLHRKVYITNKNLFIYLLINNLKRIFKIRKN